MRQKGLRAVVLLIILVVVGVVGFGAWLLLVDKPSNKSTTSSQSKSTTFKVPELGIQIVNIPSSLSDLNYAVNVNGAQSGWTYAFFSTVSLSKLDSDCSPTGHVSNNGGLTKHDGNYTSPSQLGEGSPDQFVKQLSGYWISYGHPQAACSVNTSAEALHGLQMKAFQALVTEPTNILAL